MKSLSYIISLIFLWSTGAMAFAPGFLQVAGSGGTVSVSTSETFDPTGYDWIWSETNNPDEDCATAPCPLAGSGQSLKLPYDSRTALSITATNSVNIEFLFRTSSLPTSSILYTLYLYNDSTELGYVAVTTSNKLYGRNGTAFDDGGALSADTTYHVWVEFSIGTGTNGIIRVYYTPYTGSETKPGASAVVTTGTSTLQINKLVLMRLGFNDSGYTYIDNFDY